jgi:hypothetical protein
MEIVAGRTNSKGWIIGFSSITRTNSSLGTTMGI